MNLRQILTDHFNESELRTLCFDLDIDYESLPGQGKADKARELVAHCNRHSRIPALLKEVGKQQRSDITWTDIPQPNQVILPSSSGLKRRLPAYLLPTLGGVAILVLILIGALRISIYGFPAFVKETDTPIQDKGQPITPIQDKGQPICKTGSSTGIAGRVVSAEDNKPISNVNVISDPPTDAVTTDEQGYYLICDLPNVYSDFGNKYTMTAVKQGYQEKQLSVTAYPKKTATANFIMQKKP